MTLTSLPAAQPRAWLLIGLLVLAGPLRDAIGQATCSYSPTSQERGRERWRMECIRSASWSLQQTGRARG